MFKGGEGGDDDAGQHLIDEQTARSGEGRMVCVNLPCMTTNRRTKSKAVLSRISKCRVALHEFPDAVHSCVIVVVVLAFHDNLIAVVFVVVKLFLI